MKIAASKLVSLTLSLMASSLCLADSAADSVRITATVTSACSVNAEFPDTSFQESEVALSEFDWNCTNGASPTLILTDEHYGRSALSGYAEESPAGMSTSQYLALQGVEEESGIVNFTLEF